MENSNTDYHSMKIREMLLRVRLKKVKDAFDDLITESYPRTIMLKTFEEYRDYWYEQAGCEQD